VNQLFKLGEKDTAYKYAMDIRKYAEGVALYLKADKIKESNKKRTSAITLQVLSQTLKENGYTKESTEIDKFLEEVNLNKELN